VIIILLHLVEELNRMLQLALAQSAQDQEWQRAQAQIEAEKDLLASERNRLKVAIIHPPLITESYRFFGTGERGQGAR
jgi:hypothetical protein